MGEQETFVSSNHIYIVIMRNSRGKLFIYVAVLGVLCFFVFLLSSTHTSLKELESINEKCQQQRDSLSAQLQVVYEHKNRLEKSLQQEKTDHRHTKEVTEKQVHELETKLREEKDKGQKLETQVTQLKTSYTELEEDKVQSEAVLKEQMKTAQAQKNTEIEKLQNHISELLAEKDKLEMSNNAFAWKIEQHASEVNLCHLQQQQMKTELSTCQEQLQKHIQNAAATHLFGKGISTNTKKSSENAVDAVDHPVPKDENEHHEPSAQENHMAEEPKTKAANKSVPVNEKPAVLEKPHVMPANNGDGVLPKPMVDKPDDVNKDVDAAVELPDLRNSDKDMNKHILNNLDERDVESKIDLVNVDKRESKLKFDVPKLDNGLPKEQENHPQVLPPNNFDNIGEKDDHAAERGEYGPQYALPDVKQQVEVPVFSSKFNGRHKNFGLPPQHSNNDIAAAQMQDMMNKSPGNINKLDEQNVLHMPFQDDGPINKKISKLKEEELEQRRMEDKNYEEDDDDRENDDEPANGMQHGIKGMNILQDNDFDDQENQDNIDNAKEEEGVVVAPK